MMEQNNQIAIRPATQSAVEMRREMVKNPAVMDSLGPVERAVFLASTAKTIADYSPTELAAELKTALKWISKDIGYRATDESDMQYLVIRTTEILKRYYANLTLKDFRMAFEMSITGELDDFLPKGRDGQPDRNHYQQFNAEYVCKILNAYKGRRGWVMKKAFESVMPVTPEPKNNPVYRKQAKRDCIFAFLFFKYHSRMPEISSIGELIYYELLESVGLADEIVVTATEQKWIWQRTINEYARNGMIGDVNRLKNEGINSKSLEYGAFSFARRKALERTFARMVQEEIQITDYIKV